MKIFLKINILIAISISTLMCFSNMFALVGSSYEATFEVVLDSEIGTSMVNATFEDTVIIEKIDDLNYIYLSTKEDNAITEFKFSLGNYLLGLKTIDNNTVLYVLSDDNLYQEITVQAYVGAMSSSVEFGLTINNDLNFISNDIQSFDDLPPQYIPEFSIDNYDFGTQLQGSVITLPSISAKISNLDCEVTITAFYQVGSQLNEVELLGNNLKLSNSGNYFIFYTATSEDYLTYNNELSSNELYFKIFVMSDGGISYSVYVNEDNTMELGDYNAVLTSFVSLKTEAVTAGVEFEVIKLSLAKISTNFKVYNINVLDSNEEVISYNSKMLLSIKIDGTYDRSKTELYYFTNDSIVKINSDIYLNKIVSDTHLIGTFIVVENNVQTVNGALVSVVVCSSVFGVSLIGLLITTVGYFKRKKGDVDV